jgi:hypothetical protein
LKILTMRTLILTLLLGITLVFSCTNGVENQSNITPSTSAFDAPTDTALAYIEATNVNCWIEQGQFFVIGTCDNLSNEWQKIWLKMTPMDAKGNQLKMNGASYATFATFSDAVPPRGRTSFFVGWPLTAFSGTPDSCIVTGANALVMSPGPILIITEQSGVKMLTPENPSDTVSTVEKAWQVNVMVENPLEIKAYHPRVELLLFGKDERLWFASVLNPEDPQQKEYVAADGEGPIEPKGKRRIGAYIHYEHLPQALKDKKIGRADFQPFEARPQ